MPLFCNIFDADLIKPAYTIKLSNNRIRVKEIIMKNISVKAVSAVLAASMLFSVAACNKKNNSGREKSRSGSKISADSPWFDTRSIDFDIGLDSSREVDYTYQRLAGADENYIVVLTTGYYKMPDGDDIDWENWDYNAYSINLASVVDRKAGKIIREIDLSSGLSSNDYLEDATYSDGILTAMCNGYDQVTYESTQKQIDFDITTGKITDTRNMELDLASIERSFNIGKHKVETEIVWDENTYYILHVISQDGEETSVELKENGKDYYDIPVVFPVSDTTALVPVSTDNGYLYFELDLNTCKITSKDAKDYDWIDISNVYSPFVTPEGKVYFTSSTGISRVDFKKKTTEEFFNLGWCGISRNKISYLEIADISEDSFILCGEDYNSTPYSSRSSSDFVIIEFTRAATNPHAGKTILELYASWGYTEDNISDAITKFNETNGSYFIEVSDRYSKVNDDIDYSNINSDDDYSKVQLGADSNMSNQLAMDILNGEGPDILMDVSSYGQLNSKTYLADLSSYVGQLDSEKYFTNVIEASKVDGNLYNLPVCFMISGIHTDAKYAGASGVGFTTAEYEKFLKETLNGKDVISSGQPYYFAQLFTNMSDKFIKDGKADFSNEDFKDLALFVKENVRENAREWDDYSDGAVTYESYAYAVGTMVKGDMGYSDDLVAYYTSCYGMSGYLSEVGQLNGATAILGIPSTDGRGPTVNPYVSVAVSAQACNVDACGEFVKMLLSDDIQEDLALNDNFVLNREAFRKAGKAAVDYYNSDPDDGRYGIYVGYGNDGSRIKYSEKNIEDLENIVLSCSKMHSADSAINLILVEEMPAYFSGQKELDDVIRIAQDRAQKVLDERG